MRQDFEQTLAEVTAKVVEEDKTKKEISKIKQRKIYSEMVAMINDEEDEMEKLLSEINNINSSMGETSK